jgi:hypothetical protein
MATRETLRAPTQNKARRVKPRARAKGMVRVGARDEVKVGRAHLTRVFTVSAIYPIVLLENVWQSRRYLFFEHTTQAECSLVQSTQE